MFSKRIKYFLTHLSGSIIVGLLLIVLVFFIWYPAPLAAAEGVITILFMLLVVDVIIGPLLSLLVYKEGKKTLKMDLSIIILVQALALSYGVYAIAQSRPAWIVQSGWLFEVVPANAIDKKDQLQAQFPYHRNGWLKPQWVAVDDAKNPKNSLAAPHLMMSTFNHMSYADQRLKQHSQSLATLMQFNEQQIVKSVLNKTTKAKYWMPLRTSGVGLTVLLDEHYQILKVVDLRPWQE